MQRRAMQCHWEHCRRRMRQYFTFQLHSAKTSVTSYVILCFALIFTHICSFNIKNTNAGVVVFGCNLILLTTADLPPVFVPGNVKWWCS